MANQNRSHYNRVFKPGFTSQLRALFFKNASLQRKQRKSNCCQLCIPILCVIVAGVMQVTLAVMAGPSSGGTFDPMAYIYPGNPNIKIPGNGYSAIFASMGTNCSSLFPINPGVGMLNCGCYQWWVTAPGDGSGVKETDIGRLFRNGTNSSGLVGGIPQYPYPVLDVAASANQQYNYLQKYNYTRMLVPYNQPEPSESALDDTVEGLLNGASAAYSTAYNENQNSGNNYNNNFFNVLYYMPWVYTVPTGSIVFKNLSFPASTIDVVVQGGVGRSLRKIYPNTCENQDTQTQIMKTFSQLTNAFMAEWAKSHPSHGPLSISTRYDGMPFIPPNNGMGSRNNAEQMSFLLNMFAFIFLPFSLSFILPVFTYTIVLEREQRLMEHMKIMGLRSKYYWIVAFLYDFVIYMCVAIVLVAMGAAFGIPFFKNTNPAAYLALFVLWGPAQISVAYLISSFFERTRYPIVLCYTLVIAAIFIACPLNLYVFEDERPNPAYFIYPPFAFIRGFYLLVFTSVSSPATFGSQFAEVCGWMLGITIIFLLLAAYITEVMPYQVGTRRSLLFPITDLIALCSGTKKRKEAALLPDVKYNSADIIQLEDEDEDVLRERRSIWDGTASNCAVVVKNLRKQYGSEGDAEGTTALDGLFLTIHEGECLGLLGPNGAGKTTLVSILSGIFKPTSGQALVNGHPLTDMQAIREDLGYCPQFDVLWDDLTVKQHLLFYARLKGINSKEEKEHVTAVIEEVGLEEHADAMSKDLSGGMKRRLSVAIALVGNPALVLLDEPTSGLDPASKQALWDVLQSVKTRRGASVLLTTHSMEEADVLSTRIGIMARGKLRCIGSPLHLKHKFGKGFKLSITCDISHVDRADQFIREIIPLAQSVYAFGSSHVYAIPRHGLQLSKIFGAMESRRAIYGIKDWSVSQASLEEVFMAIVEEEEGAQEARVAGDGASSSAKTGCCGRTRSTSAV